VTKQEAVETVKARIAKYKKLGTLHLTLAAEELQWALDLLTDCDETKGK